MRIFPLFALFRVFQYRSLYQSLYYNSLIGNCISSMIEDAIVQEVVNENFDITDNNMLNDKRNVGNAKEIIESNSKNNNIVDNNECNNASNEPQVLLLPPSIEGGISEDRTLQLGGTLSMDELGPIIINTDGSLRRIENWDKLSKAEQANSFRLIAARNKKRIEILKQKEIEAKNENEKTENPNNESERINKSEEMINNS